MRFIPVLAITIVGLLAVGVACGGDEKEAAATPSPAAESEGEPTPSPEPTIPSDFTTYTDEEQVFSISYPSDWELVLSELPDIEEATRELLESKEFDTPLKDVHVIFGARMPSEQGTPVSVTINVEPVDVSTLEELARGREALGLPCREFAQVEAMVGDRSALIFDYECDIPFLGKARGIQMFVLDGKTSWGVTCSAPPEEFPSIEDTCNQVVRSLRILR